MVRSPFVSPVCHILVMVDVEPPFTAQPHLNLSWAREDDYNTKLPYGVTTATLSLLFWRHHIVNQQDFSAKQVENMGMMHKKISFY